MRTLKLRKFAALVMIWLMVSLSLPQFPSDGAEDGLEAGLAAVLSSLSYAYVAAAQSQFSTCEPCVQAGRAWCISYGSSGIPSGRCATGTGCIYGENAYVGNCPAQLSCQDACSAKYYGSGGSYTGSYNFNSYSSYATGQASYGNPVGTCYNRNLQFSSISVLYTQRSSTGASATNIFIQPPQPINSLGLCSDPDDVCWCAVINLNAAYTAGTTTITGTTRTSHWPPSDQYYVKSGDEPKKQATDADCEEKSTLTLSSVKVNNQSTKVQSKLIAAGQPITIEGEAKYSSTVCNGYQYTCEKFTELSCEQGRKGFLGMTQYKKHKNCAKAAPDTPNKLGGEGEEESFCWGCLANIGIILLDVAAMAFLGVPPNVAIPAAEALMQLTPALDGCDANYQLAAYLAANAASNYKTAGTSSGSSGPGGSGGSGSSNPFAPSDTSGNSPATGKAVASATSGTSTCVACIDSKQVWCAVSDRKGTVVGGTCVSSAGECAKVTGAMPIYGNAYMCPGEDTYEFDDAAASILQMLPYAANAWSCDLLKDVDCWSACGREYTVNVSASPRCSQGGPLKRYSEAQYTCSAPVSCGSLTGHAIAIQFVQGDDVIKEDATTTDENGRFSITTSAPNVNGEVSLVVRSSV